MVGKRKPVVESELAVRSQQPPPTLKHSSTQTKLTNERPDEPRRSGRATKGQHTKNHEEAPPPSKKKGKGKGSKAATSEAEENGDDEAIVRCICGDTEDYRGWMMIVCEQCEAWQHNFCMGVPEDDAQLPDQYYCEQCRPQNHKELVEAMRRGEKPWEEKIRRREEEENQKKKKGSRKSKGARASGVSADHQDASPRGSATPAAQPETVGKRKAVGIEIPVAPVNPRVSKGSQRKEANSGGQQMSPVTSHAPHPASPIGQRRKSTFDENPLKRRKSVVDDTAAKRRKSGAEGSLARRDSITLPPVDSLDQLPKERQGVANALQKSIKDLIDGSVKHNTYRVPDGQTPTVLATELALKIEYALYQRFPSEEEKSTYAEQFRSLETTWRLDTAHNLEEAKRALADLQLMGQNIMIGTVDGDIYYVRNGRVPIRPQGCDPSRPMSGSSGDCEWQGIHPFADLVQITNPPQGYMQNCNVSPFAMMKDSPLVPEKWAGHPYLYNDFRRPPHQRAAMMLDLLDAAHNVTAEQAMAIAFSTQVWHAELWQQRIRQAAPASGFGRMLAEWDRRTDAGSRAALGFYFFKVALGSAGRGVDPPSSLTDDAIVAALEKAEQRLQADFSPDAVFGTLFRVGREGGSRTWPVGGGTLAEAGMATPRAISFNPVGKEMVGHSGQTSTQIVILTKPPRSFMVIPLGESDHKESGHWDDQAEKLFSQARAKPTYFLDRRELEKHVTARRELSYQ